MYVCMHACMYVHTDTHPHTPTHGHTHAYTHILCIFLYLLFLYLFTFLDSTPSSNTSATTSLSKTSHPSLTGNGSHVPQKQTDGDKTTRLGFITAILALCLAVSTIMITFIFYRKTYVKRILDRPESTSRRTCESRIR